MQKVISFAASFLFAALAAGVAHAEGDAAAGKSVYEAQCLSCHGVAGASVIPANPILSGQHYDYLKEQIAAYKNGARQNAIMAGMVTALTDAQVADIAQYLSEQRAVIVGAADTDAAALGERLYRGGVIGRELPACAACHGPAGEGIPALAPRIAGQHKDYTILALKAYADGTRANAPMMNSISPKLSETEMQQLAEFLAGLAE